MRVANFVRAVAVLAISASAASAQVVGQFNGAGSLSANGEAGLGQPVNLIFTGSPLFAIPTLDGIFSSIAPGSTGSIQNVSLGTGAFNEANFIQISGYTFSLLNVAEGSATAATCLAPAVVGQSCTPPNTPFTLSNVSNGRGGISSTASFTVNGWVTTPTQEVFQYDGIFTAQFANTSYQQLIATIDQGTSLPVSYSLSIEAANSTVPEPATFALMGSGLIALAGIGRMRRKQV